MRARLRDEMQIEFTLMNGQELPILDAVRCPRSGRGRRWQSPMALAEDGIITTDEAMLAHPALHAQPAAAPAGQPHRPGRDVLTRAIAAHRGPRPAGSCFPPVPAQAMAAQGEALHPHGWAAAETSPEDIRGMPRGAGGC